MDEKEMINETSIDELCNQALYHYNLISSEAMHYNNLIPKAIEFYRKYKVFKTLIQNWRDSAGESGESAYSEVMECADELEKAQG